MVADPASAGGLQVTVLALPGQVACPKRLWAGMARDACCTEQAMRLCPEDCPEGKRAKAERRQFLEAEAKRVRLRRELGYRQPTTGRGPSGLRILGLR